MMKESDPLTEETPESIEILEETKEEVADVFLELAQETAIRTFESKRKHGFAMGIRVEDFLAKEAIVSELVEGGGKVSLCILLKTKSKRMAMLFT